MFGVCIRLSMHFVLNRIHNLGLALLLHLLLLLILEQTLVLLMFVLNHGLCTFLALPINSLPACFVLHINALQHRVIMVFVVAGLGWQSYRASNTFLQSRRNAHINARKI